MAAKLALDCASNWALGSSIIILSVLGDGCNEELGDFIQNCETICTIEDDSGALKQYVQDFLLNMMNKGSFDISVHRPAPLLVSKTVTKPSPSFRTFAACAAFHGFTSDGVQKMLEESLTGRGQAGLGRIGE